MPAAPAPVEVFCCPRCEGALSSISSGGWGCTTCRTNYPTVGNIPCFVDDPTLWRTLWLRRFDDYSSNVELRVNALRAEAENPQLLPRTRMRLLRIAEGFVHQVEAVASLFESMDADGGDPLSAMAIPSRPEGGSQTAVLECYENVFRDWVWGQEENALTLDFLKPLIPAGAGRIGVYGAGAGRLAVDVHQHCGPGTTFALDVNPLPFLIANRMLSGETLTLPEFPVDPNSDNEVVIARDLVRPFVPRDGFGFVFADALRPPFRPGSLDVVVTSWFIDIARADIRQTAAAINRVLRPGGLWVNIGPLRFQTNLARAYSIEEVLELVGMSAFELLSSDKQRIPYFDSPASGSRRSDMVFRFVARKAAEAPATEVPDTAPPWVTNPMLPIPITQSMIALGRTSMFTSSVLGMIDGTRSIVEVAQALAAAWGVEPSRLHDELRAFFARLPAS